MTTQHDKAKRWQLGILDVAIIATVFVGLIVGWWQSALENERLRKKLDEYQANSIETTEPLTVEDLIESLDGPPAPGYVSQEGIE